MLITVAAYAPSIAGGFVWDDHWLLAGNDALTRPADLFTSSVWEHATTKGDLYRPLVMLSYTPSQLFVPGPLVPRLVNLALHLIAVASLGFIGVRWGLPAGWACFSAACFALHPGASEAVAWLTGRHDLLPAVLVLVSWALLESARIVPSALLLSLTPWCKESYLLAPVVAGVWSVSLLAASDGRERRAVARRAMPYLATVASVALVLAVRRLIAMELPLGAAAHSPVAAIGATALRGVELFFAPMTATAIYDWSPHPVVGWVASLAGIGVGIWALRNPRALRAWGALLFVAPAAPAAADIGLIADRYFYLPIAVGCLAIVAAAYHWGRAFERPLRLTLIVVPLLTIGTAIRAADWRSDLALFSHAHALAPESAAAAFHYGHALHEREGDCAAAVPLYEAATNEPRAAANLVACLTELGEIEGAFQTARALIAIHPEHPTLVENGARVGVQLGELDTAARWTRALTRVEEDDPANWLLRGNLAGQRGDLDEAERCFRRALSLDPDSSRARTGLQAVQQRRAGQGEE